MADQFEVCPKCQGKNFNFEFDDWESDSIFVWRKITCSCGFSWNEVYKFDYNENPITFYALDETGNDK